VGNRSPNDHTARGPANAVDCKALQRYLLAGTFFANPTNGQVTFTSLSRTSLRKTSTMRKLIDRSGKVGYILLWLLGVPIPILLLIFLLRGCT
jgi:hypothetical protein